MSNIRQSDVHSIGTAWPFVEASIETLQAKNRPTDPPPGYRPPTHSPLPPYRRIASLAVGEATTVFGAPRYHIQLARALVVGKWKSEHVSGTLWSVERVA